MYVRTFHLMSKENKDTYFIKTEHYSLAKKMNDKRPHHGWSYEPQTFICPLLQTALENKELVD